MMFLSVMLDALLDTLKLLPFLFIMYLLMEWLENKAGDKAIDALHKSGPFAPIIGALFGIIPQCGFSAAASVFYAAGHISIGALCAIFMSTSDELLPILLSHSIAWQKIVWIIGIKFVCGIVFGYLLNLLFRLFSKTGPTVKEEETHHNHEEDEKHSLFVRVLLHTGQITLFVLVINIVLGLALEFLGDSLSAFVTSVPVLANMLSALVGLIPNCAASILISTLYAENVLPAGALISGLLINSGVGSIVLFRSHRNVRRNIMLLVYMFVISVGIGYLVDLVGWF